MCVCVCVCMCVIHRWGQVRERRQYCFFRELCALWVYGFVWVGGDDDEFTINSMGMNNGLPVD